MVDQSTQATPVRQRATQQVFKRAFFLVCFLLLASCGAHEAPKPKTRPAPLVSVSKVSVRDVSVSVKGPVDLRPIAQAEVSAKTQGYLDAVLVDRGDRVKKGQLLALVRPSDLPDQLVAARSSLTQTQAQVELAKSNAERARKMFSSGLISQQELTQAEATLATTSAAEAGARAQIAAVGTRLGEARIDCPFDGVVVSRRLDPGALVGTATSGSIVTVARTEVLRAFLAVNERDALGVTIGKEAELEFDSVPGQKFVGKVARLAPAFDAATRTLEAEIHLPNPNDTLRPGMYGRGAIVLDVHKQRPVVPVNAVQISNKQRYVFVVDGDKVHRRRIQTGVDAGDWFEVLNGLEGGEDIVTAGLESLSENASIRVAPASSSGAKSAASAAPSGHAP